MYHVNNQGKVYRCRAKIRKCPYHIHGATREEAMRKSAGLVEYGRNTFIDQGRIDYVERHGQLPYIKLDSVFWNYDKTLEGELNTLYAVEKAYQEHGWKAWTNRRPTLLGKEEHKIKEFMYDFYRLGGRDIAKEFWKIRYYKESTFVKKTLEEFRKEYDHDSMMARHSRESDMFYDLQDRFTSPKMVKMIQLIDKWLNSRKTREQVEERKKLIRNAIQYIENYLIVEKMLNRAKFRGTPDQIINSIRNLSNDELISVFEDYNVSDRELDEVLEKVKYFERNPDVEREISDYVSAVTLARKNRANKELLEARKKENKVDNLLILLEAHAELERRNIHHVDIIDTRWDY